MCYDQNGNMPRRNATTSSCTNGDTLSYDDGNRLTSITVGATTTNYFYSGDGARVKKSANGVTTYYVGNLYEYTVWTGGSSTSKYYYFGGQRVAVKQDINVSYIHGDHLGSTSKTTGASASTQTYFPFGAIKTSSGTPPTDYGFTGQKRDATANLMFYGARYYDAALGRFIQPDTIVPNPMDPQSLNRYSYVRNNPVNRIDPTGHEDCAAEDDWCWQNRWYEAHGYCWSDAKQDWAKQCQPEFQDENILKEVIREGGEAPSEILQRLLGAIQNGKFKFVLPNVFILGFQVQGGLVGGYGVYGAAYAQIVFDYKHNQIGYFYGGELGGILTGTPSVGVSASFGIGWGGSAFTSVSSYSRWTVGGGISGTAPVAGAFGIGLGTDVLVSADDSFVGDTWKLTPNPDNLLLVQPSLSLGTAGGEVHWYAAYSIEDLPSDYLGFNADVTGRNLVEIVSILQGRPVTTFDPLAVDHSVLPTCNVLQIAGAADPNYPPTPRQLQAAERCWAMKNLQWRPKIPTGDGEFVNVDWPDALQMPAPLGRGSGWWEQKSCNIFSEFNGAGIVSPFTLRASMLSIEKYVCGPLP